MSGGENRRLWAGAVLYGLVAMALVLLLASLFYLVRNAQDGQATRQLLIECTVPPQDRTPPVRVTNPKADCYTRAQRQQGEAINSLSTVSVVAAACGAAHPGDVPGTRKCVDRALNP